MAAIFARPRIGCMAVLQRQPEGGYTDTYDAYEVVCRDCGDDPSLDYQEVPPMLQRLRGPYWLEPGAAALEMHVEWHGKRLQDPPATTSR